MKAPQSPLPSAYLTLTLGKKINLRITMIGTDFEIRVWETLLKIPFGDLTSYSSIAGQMGKPKAARAVGTAVGKNPPFHSLCRAIGWWARLVLFAVTIGGG